MAQEDSFKRCSTCREPIAFEQKYWACSVSTCNRSKLAVYFCSLPCWEAHVPEARHRDAWAEEQQAPTRAAYLAEQSSATPALASPTARVNEGGREARIIVPRTAAVTDARPRDAGGKAVMPEQTGNADDDEILVVVSKLKKYIRDRSGMNTSDTAIAPLSDHLRSLCRQAIRHAGEDGRKTVMDRDFLPFLEPRR